MARQRRGPLLLLAAVVAAPWAALSAAQTLLITQAAEGSGTTFKMLVLRNVDGRVSARLGDYGLCRAAAPEGDRASRRRPGRGHRGMPLSMQYPCGIRRTLVGPNCAGVTGPFGPLNSRSQPVTFP